MWSPQGPSWDLSCFYYIKNYIMNFSDIAKFILFADDTNMFMHHENIDMLVNLANNELSKLSCLV